MSIKKRMNKQTVGGSYQRSSQGGMRCGSWMLELTPPPLPSVQTHAGTGDTAIYSGTLGAGCQSFLIWNCHWHWNNVQCCPTLAPARMPASLSPHLQTLQLAFSKVRSTHHLPQSEYLGFCNLPRTRQVLSYSMDFHTECGVPVLVRTRHSTTQHRHPEGPCSSMGSCEYATNARLHSAGTIHDPHQGFH